MQHAGKRKSRQGGNENMHVVPRYGEAAQGLALAVEIVERIDHDALLFWPAQGT